MYTNALLGQGRNNTRGIVYGAREAHNLTGWVRLPVPQHKNKKTHESGFFYFYVVNTCELLGKAKRI